MSNSTSLLDQLSTSQAQAEVLANQVLDALSQSALFGRRASACSGLVWGYYGGALWVDGALTAIANGTVTLTNGATNYIEATFAGVVSANTSGFTAGRIPLYEAVTASSAVSSWTDRRIPNWPNPGAISVSIAGAAGDQTLTAAQARAPIIILTGAITGARNIILPAIKAEWIVRNDATGAFDVTVKTAAGTGVVVDAANSTKLYCDGTNIKSAGGGSALPVVDTTEIVKGSSDATKKLRMEVDGFTTGTTRVATWPDKDGTVAMTSDIPGSGAGATDLSENAAGHSGLNYAYNSGVIRSDNTITVVAASSVLLTDAATNYIECSSAGTVSANTIGFTAGKFPMATAVTAASAIGTVTDKRSWVLMVDALATLTGAQTLTNKTLDESNRITGTPGNAQTGTTYTLVLSDAGKLVTLSNASAIALTIPTNDSVAFPVNTRIDLAQLGAGKVTVGGAGVTINSKSGNKSIGAQYVGATLVKTATDTWLLLGDLIA